MSLDDDIPSTFPMSQIDDFVCSAEPSPALPEPWGHLLVFPPSREEEKVIYLTENKYTFGKYKDSTHVFKIPDKTASPNAKRFYGTVSRHHFTIEREPTKNGRGDELLTYVYDHSSNGTYINRDIVGRQKKRMLRCFDEITIGAVDSPGCFRQYTFVDKSSSTADSISSTLPPEVTERYCVARTVGSGGFGQVRRAYRIEDNEVVALKIIDHTRINTEPGGVSSRVQVGREVAILKSISHPCIVSVYDVFLMDRFSYIVMEFAHGGELFNRVQKEQIPESLSKLYFYQMLLAVKYLHDQNITHRDLKPENILLGNAGKDECLIKIADFGLSKFFSDGSELKTFCGTRAYNAPEIIAGNGKLPYTSAIDLWSLGVILFICLGGYMPFCDDPNRVSVETQIQKAKYNFHPSRFTSVSEFAKDLIRRLLKVNVDERITAEDALRHTWMDDDAMRTKAYKIMYGNSTNGSADSTNGLVKTTDHLSLDSNGNTATPTQDGSFFTAVTERKAPQDRKRPRSGSEESAATSTTLDYSDPGVGKDLSNVPNGKVKRVAVGKKPKAS